jgi:hypothetical protein
VPSDEKIPITAEWWEESSDNSEEVPPSYKVELAGEFDGETFYIDGLRDGHYLAIDLRALAGLIAAGG